MRMWQWTVGAAVLFLAIAWIAPHQLPVTLYKAHQVLLFAVLGFAFDYSVFTYAPPSRDAPLHGMRRAIVISAFVLGGAIGL